MSIDFGNDIYEEPIVAKTFLQEDVQEGSLRPKTLREYIGQEKAKEKCLAIFIEAAQKREESLDHVLLHGPPGLGKTDPGWHHRAGNECEYPYYFRSGD